MKISIKEIERLNKVIDVLFQASDDSEVDTIIRNHRAVILHHEDIISVARNELVFDKEQKEEITKAINNLLKEIAKGPVVQTDVDKYASEIRQLQATSDELCEVREHIKELLDQLDRKRDPTTGEAESITSAEKRKNVLQIKLSFEIVHQYQVEIKKQEQFPLNLRVLPKPHFL